MRADYWLFALLGIANATALGKRQKDDYEVDGYKTKDEYGSYDDGAEYDHGKEYDEGYGHSGYAAKSPDPYPVKSYDPYPEKPYPEKPYPEKPYPEKPYPEKPYPTSKKGYSEKDPYVAKDPYAAKDPYPTDKSYPTKPDDHYPSKDYPTKDYSYPSKDYPSDGGYSHDYPTKDYPSGYPSKDYPGDDYPTHQGHYDEYDEYKGDKEPWHPKTEHPEFFSLRVDDSCDYDDYDCPFDNFAIRLENGIVIATPYNKWWDPKLPIFFVDDDTQLYTVSKKPLQLYIDTVTGALRYAEVGWLPPDSIAYSFYKTGNNPLGKVDPSPASLSWPSTEGNTLYGNGPWSLCSLGNTGQFQVFVNPDNYGGGLASGVWKDPYACRNESLAAINANPWKKGQEYPW
ncbi:hypothetical protein ACN47E_006264 [Coniothyrium glycines]